MFRATSMQRILSGVQPSGVLHLGNYFGMMRPAIELQQQGEPYYFIANYHSMTSLFDAAQRRQVNTIRSSGIVSKPSSRARAWGARSAPVTMRRGLLTGPLPP